MPTVFTRIIDGEFPGHFVWRDETCAAFLSINPLTPGHTLVVPRAEVDHWLDLDVATNQHLTAVAHHVGTAISTTWSPPRVGTIIAGYEVPHVHVHVFATWDMGDFDFSTAAASVDPDELASNAKTLRAALRAAGHDTQAGEPGD
ncbi:MAG: HIT family protein [Acidimicrobiales bacterium]